MDEENNKPRVGVSRSFIFAIFIVLAIIGLVAYFIFSSANNAKTLQDNAFIYYLSNGKVTDVQIVLAETETSANGHVMLVDAKGNPVSGQTLIFTVNGKERKTYLAVNEMRIENVIKTQTIDVYINEKKLETYRGTGLCVCTQVGSTAYNRSLRGAVVEAGMEIMELTEITGIHHIHYRSLGVPIIMSGNNTIRMLSKYDDTSLLCFDRYAINLDGAESIETTLSDVEFKVARYRKTDYIDHLYHLYT